MAGIKPQGPGIPLIRLNMQAPGSGHVAKIPRAVKWSNGASSARHPGSTQLVRDAAQLREMEIGGSRRSSHSILGNKSRWDDFSLSAIDRVTLPQQREPSGVSPCTPDLMGSSQSRPRNTLADLSRSANRRKKRRGNRASRGSSVGRGHGWKFGQYAAQFV